MSTDPFLFVMVTVHNKMFTNFTLGGLDVLAKIKMCSCIHLVYMLNGCNYSSDHTHDTDDDEYVDECRVRCGG